MNIKNAPVNTQVEETGEVYDVSRRRFFQLAGGIAGAGLLLSACHTKTASTDTFLGDGDIALLNYLYILEQLEAAFYTQAVATPYYGLTTSESQLLTDVRDQEIAHSGFLKTLLGANAISAISLNFSAVTFTDRTSVLSHALLFEDLVVSAYNGVVQLFSDTTFAITVSKMVSVEARHSAYFRDILTYNSFADTTVVNSSGLDQAVSPGTGLLTAEAYIHTRFDSSKLPNY